MRIDSLSGSPDRAGRYRVKLSDDSILRLYRQTVEDFGLYAGLELTDPQMEALRAAAGKMSAKMRAVRIVSASSVSCRDLEQRLTRKGETAEDAKQAVAWMEDLHLLDDRNTAEQVVHSCIRKGYGKARARQVLYEKRIPRDLWEEALEDYPDQLDKIESFLRSRLDEKAEPKDVKRAVDALLRRGHSYSRIREALNSLCFDTEDISEDF